MIYEQICKSESLELYLHEMFVLRNVFNFVNTENRFWFCFLRLIKVSNFFKVQQSASLTCPQNKTTKYFQPNTTINNVAMFWWLNAHDIVTSETVALSVLLLW